MAGLTVTLFNFFRYGNSVPQKIITNGRPIWVPVTREQFLTTVNPDYFDMSRPRSDIQFISVMLNSQNENRTGPNFLPSAVRLDDFLATAGWKRIASFVEPAR
jgi:hypothetical protein